MVKTNIEEKIDNLKREEIMDTDIKETKRFLELIGCTVLKPKHKNANGPDLNVIKNDEAL